MNWSCAHEAVLLQAAQTGDAPAVVHLNQTLTYRELRDRAKSLAACLLTLGVTPGSLVGLCLGRSLHAPVGILGTLIAGGAYVPLDPSYPTERLRWMLEDSQASVLITERAYQAQFANFAGRVLIMEDLEFSVPSTLIPAPVTASELAYVIYTSGSTGKPKGVALPHAALANLMRWHAAHPSYRTPARTLQFSPLSFDVSFQEIFSTWITGGTLVLIDESTRRDALGLLQYIHDHHIERIFVPYVVLLQLADAAVATGLIPESLREVTTAGEQLQINDKIRRFFERAPNATLHNHYGPSETHVVTAHTLSRNPKEWVTLPSIGGALPNVELHLLDPDGHPVSPGQPGELFLGGVALAREYWRREDLTRERFVPHPSGQGRLYRTGDLVSQAVNGELDFLGRADQQVKVRGFRVELGEVEAGLSACPGVREAVVVAEGESGDKRLRAFVVLEGQAGERTEASLREQLAKQLPDYMVPSAFAFLASLPLTPSGKVDRRALSASNRQRPELSEAYVEPGTSTERVLADLWRDLLRIDRVGVDDSFFELGGTSLMTMQLATRIFERLKVRVPTTVLFQRPTVRSLARHLDAPKAEPGSTQSEALAHAASSWDSDSIAIVGMACRLPGAPNLETFWSNLQAGVDSIAHFSDEEWRAEGVAEELLADPNFVKARGLCAEATSLDAAFFGISPREATLTDPQQRLFLETCWTALEHAGQGAVADATWRIGVWGGVSTGMRSNTYLLHNLYSDPSALGPEERVTAMIGNQNDYIATRVAYKLGLRGPAVSVQTACSTSLVAVVQACQSLLAGDCDMALAGGACVLFPEKQGYLFQPGDIGSSDGRCRPFDARADGTVFSDGVGTVVLKRLSAALEDGNTIYAVIKGAAVNNDGSEKMSFSAPSADGQSEVVRRAHQLARFAPSTIGYIEAHGTATPIGDPIEVQGLLSAFSGEELPPHSCALGSVKSNVGHLIAAAGVAGLIKTALCLYHRRLVPTAHFEQPNPQIDFPNTPFFVNQEASPWPQGATPRRAGVSAFGLGGTNAHVALEEPPRVQSQASARRFHPIVLSARSKEALEARTAQLVSFLAERPDANLADVAFTLAQGRAALNHRRAVVAENAAGVLAALEARDPARLFTQATRTKAAKVVFMFPGGGAQYARMGAGLYEAEPVFREWLDRGFVWLHGKLDVDLKSLWFGQDTAAFEREFQRPSVQLPALFLLEVALTHLWRAWGVEPEAFIGHSMGENTAAHLAGVMSFEAGLGLVTLRGQLFERIPESGMLHVPLAAEELQPLLGDLDLAVVNAPDMCVASGPNELLDRLEQVLRARDVDARRIQISIAAHSRLVEPILAPFQQYLESLDLEPPRIPFISNRSGTWIRPEEAQDPQYWVQHLRGTVHFGQGVQTLLSENAGRVLLEVGPGKTLGSLGRAQFPTANIVASLRHPKEELEDEQAFLESFARLWLAGVDLDWGKPWPNEHRQRVALPTYPFERKRFYFDPPQKERALPAPTSPIPVAEPVVINMPSSEPRYDRILLRLKEVVFELSGLEPDQQEVDTPFVEMGFDSLFLTQASLGFKRALGVKVTFRQLFQDAPCLSALARYIDGELPPDALPAAPVAQAAAAPVAVQAPAGNAQLPVASGAPITFPAGGGPANLLELVLAQQLQTTSSLLAALRGTPQGQNMPAAPLAPQALAAPAPAAAAGPSSAVGAASAKPTASGTSAVMEPDGPKRFGPYKPIERGRDGGLNDRQRRHLADLTERVLSKTPSSKALTAEHRDHFADPRAVGGFKQLWKEIVYPVAVDRSKGAYMWDIDGNQYIDCVGGFGAVLFGHAPDMVVKALEKQLHRNLDYGPTSPIAGQLAKRICALTGMDRATFCNTGSEAVLATMRLARTVTGKDKIATFTGDYHGIFDEVLVRSKTVGGKKRSVPVAPGIPQDASSNIVVLDYDNPESLKIIEERADELAAVLVEPVQSRAPHLQPREFLRALRRLTERLQIPLIFDEIITGFRAGPRGAQGFFGVEADLAAYGKVIGGGMPIGVVAGKRQYMDALDGGTWRYGDESFPEAGVTYFAGTFVRHPLTLAAIEAVLDRMEAEGPALQERVNVRCARFAAELNDHFEQRGIPIHVEHFASVVLPKYGGDPEFEGLFYQELRYLGVHIWEGRPGFMTTEHTDADFDALIARFKQAAERLVEGGFLEARPRHLSYKEVPLTEAQTELWLATQVSEEAALALNEPCSFRLTGSVCLPVLRRAFRQVVQRHDALRASVTYDGVGFRVASFIDPEIRELDLSALSESEREQARSDFYREDSRTPFDLTRGPLVRATLIKLAPDDHELLVTVHHIVCDGWSISILIHDLSQLYTSNLTGRSSQLSPPRQLADYTEWEREHAQSAEAKESQAFWIHQYSTVPAPIELPFDRPRPARKTFRSMRHAKTIDRSVGNRLKEYAKAEKCTLFSVLLSAFSVLMHRLTGQSDLAIGIPAAGQAQLGANDLIAHCVNYLPLRIQLDPAEDLANLLLRIKQQLLDSNEHQDFTLGTLLKHVSVDRDPARPTLISVDFNVDPALPGLEFRGLKAEYVSTPRDYAMLDLSLNVIETDGALLLECDHNLDLIDPETARRWMAHYEGLISDLVQNTHLPIQQIPLGSVAEQTSESEWNATGVVVPELGPVSHLFEQQAERTPDAPALMTHDGQVSYAALNARANQIARWLGNFGVSAGSTVGVYMPREPALYSVLLGILKAGAAYLPLDPDYPEERLEWMAKESGVSVVLQLQAAADSVAQPTPNFAGARVVTLAEHQAALDRTSTDPISSGPSLEAVAYVLFTSGSTGRPKGVEITHAAVAHLLHAMSLVCPLQPGDRVLQQYSLNFDPSVWEIFGTLCSGAELVVPERPLDGDAEALFEAVIRNQITVLDTVPAVLKGFSEHPRLSECRSLRRFQCGGEQLPYAVGKKCVDTLGIPLVNLYGPTEATVNAVAWTWEPNTEPERVLIGSPLANCTAYVLGPKLEPVPIGVVGELYLGGAQLFRGYVNHPEWTRERLLPDPFSQVPGARLYKTDDRVRRRASGALEFVGRTDSQVKLRGLRVELGEIESTLLASELVGECAVLVRELEGLGPELIAYVVPKPGEVVSAQSLRVKLRERLPTAMVPQHFVLLAELVRLPSGKIDIAQLPAPSPRERQLDVEMVAPTTETERWLAEIWRDVLQKPAVGIHDDFFDLGGHSLLAMRMLSKVSAAGRSRLSLRDVFESPTIAELAKRVEARSQERTPTARQAGMSEVVF